ncbi:phage terminase small subunit [Pseudomonas sp. TMW 2.1634]|uniref:phage terminase small subunit n=1 Tax=Pseudomonas sp. TMW 2.1634 TaxID=1886807 RepID=UPI000E707126|nr:phage terminase small subunit [Pseudomonas sp. TMW 2.1634]AOA08371.1 terminase [Pseudomonas sp. TMW 2.1634]
MSHALAHKRRVQLLGPTAGAPAPVYSPSTALDSTANGLKHLKLMEVSIAKDLERISGIDSRELRQQLKREELLPKYLDYVQRYLDSKLIFPNPVMMQVLVWLFDTQQFTQGLQLAQVAMVQEQELPERFKRNVQTFVADEVIDWAEAEYKAGRTPEPYVSDLLHLVDGEWQLFERIPARYHKLLGIISIDLEEWAQAISHFERAIELYPEIGVGTRLDAARKALKKAELAAAEEPPTE